MKMSKKNNSWFCIYTNPREEQIALHELINQGLHVYFPKYIRTISHARKIQKKIFPLFPRYFFALETNEVSFSLIKRTRGVANYVHQNDGNPIRIKQEIIDFIKSRENSSGYIQINNDRFTKGDKILVTNGTFTNLSAIFLKQCGHERAKIIVELLGRENILQMPLNHIDRQN
tara:strand:+ start:341 stop:859 length:519 start_codon:yes stop_codon:yes gene_type:complete